MESIYESVFGTADAFVYRCRNDEHYTMDFISSGIERLTGHLQSDILNNAKIPFAELMTEEDREGVFKQVDDAIAEGHGVWDVTFRFDHADGHQVWVRERGNAIFENGELAYLQGLIIGAEAEHSLRSALETRVVDARTASKDIVELTKQITSSVRELSMLSTNARIEAARSGDAGRGFAVVANEMKTLSERNASLADKIAQQVQTMNQGA